MVGTETGFSAMSRNCIQAGITAIFGAFVEFKTRQDEQILVQTG
jgi:hypothetical protein